jgi:glyceraldehyde 3-phosphate dehydrogenase
VTARIAINGFGRIGRLAARLLLEQRDPALTLVAVNDLMDPASCAALYKRDSIHGPAHGQVESEDDCFLVDGQRVAVTNASKPADIDHSALGVDIVIEATGMFANRAGALAHIGRGASRVLISAPAKDADITIVRGVNEFELRPEHAIVSNASCTTNALAPIAYVLERAVGIERGHMTTVHSYTNDQRLLDQYHPDLRRARGAATSLIPTSTGATDAVAQVLPQLAGKLSGASVRVPTPNVSLVDFIFNAGRQTSAAEINDALTHAAGGWLRDILATSSEPLVSGDYNHNPVSSTVDLLETKVTDGTMVRVLAWYDNEWGFANRLVEMAAHIARRLDEARAPKHDMQRVQS